MGADGSHGPRPFTQHRLSTAFLRVPREDWHAVRRGSKREFRGARGKSSATFNLQTPTPVVAYCVGRNGEHEAELMYLDRTWQEPLMAISEESLDAEGFESMAEFRRYWMRRERKRWDGMRMVFVYSIRPWTPHDGLEMGDALLARLYGEWL